MDRDMHFFKNLSIDTYVHLMKRTACLVGNSSSGIREGAFIGTPVVNIGSRQDRRERGANVMNVAHHRGEIADAIRHQVGHGAYGADPIYGDGHAGERIAKVLVDAHPPIQKTIAH
jgi:UDP-N-acetylglucosamine 2-epimerase